MVADTIMFIAGLFFMILFGFLLFLFFTFLTGLWKKEQVYPDFTPPITVLIPTYNEEKNIARCLDAVLQSSYDHSVMEIFVIDDGSSDKTVAIAKKYPNVTVIEQKHTGKVDALNLGCKKATHEFIVTIDADTFVTPTFIKEMVKPFFDKRVGATSGAVCVENKHSIVGMFQNVEYHYNNLIRQSFSRVFDTGVWFFGCLACYRKSSLNAVGGFKKDTLCEDMDIALEMKKHGFKTINVSRAIGYTVVPTTVQSLFWQRSRWWVGGLQALRKNKSMFSYKSNLAIIFLFVNHFWWAFYAFVSLPLFIFQIHYWLPVGAGIFELSGYFFRWFSLSGPVYVLYKIPDWGLSIYNIFGVLSGIITAIMILAALRMYNNGFDLKSMFVLFFYFPYTIILNLLVAGSVIRATTLKTKYFIK